MVVLRWTVARYLSNTQDGMLINLGLLFGIKSFAIYAPLRLVGAVVGLMSAEYVV